MKEWSLIQDSHLVHLFEHSEELIERSRILIEQNTVQSERISVLLKQVDLFNSQYQQLLSNEVGFNNLPE